MEDIFTPDNSRSDSVAITNAFRLFEKSTTAGDAVDNAAKDIAGLIHSIDCVDEAIDRIRRMHLTFKLTRLYCVLIVQLKALIGKPAPPISSRMVYVEVPYHYPPITLDLLHNLLPNTQKVWRVITSMSGKKCLVEFASHSSARRAVDSRQLSANHQAPSHNTVKCAWASSIAPIPPLRIEYASELPVFEVADDESTIAPSLDWRRPRPRSDSACALKCADMFSMSDLLSVLRGTGAFDDYPPLASQIRF